MYQNSGRWPTDEISLNLSFLQGEEGEPRQVEGLSEDRPRWWARPLGSYLSCEEGLISDLTPEAAGKPASHTAFPTIPVTFFYWRESNFEKLQLSEVLLHY